MTDPTPATPDEAVAALDDSLRYVGDRAGAPRRRYAEMLLANLPAGWSLSRQQGDTVAARALTDTDTVPWNDPGFRERGPYVDGWHARGKAIRRLLGMDGDK